MKLNTIGKICIGGILVLVLILIKDHTGTRLEREEAEHLARIEAAALKRWPDELLAKAIPSIEAEKKVISARWERKPPEDGSLPKLVATMKNTGGSMTGFAEYLCMVLSDHDITGTVVHPGC